MGFETFLVFTAVSSCISWMSIFTFSPVLFTWLSSIYRSLPEDRQRLVDNHFKTVVHGTFVAALAWYAYTCTEIPPGGVWLDAPLVRFESAVYFGYLISDLIQTAMYPHVSNIEFVSHHVMSLYSSYIAASYPAMPYYANVCYMMQLSNPSAFFRVILEELGYKGSQYYTWNGVTLIVTCFISRILVTGIATVNLAKIMIFQDTFSRLPLHVSLCYIFGSLLFNIMNYYWFGLICKGAIDYFWGKETKQML
ncbi:PREDICTED: transmembrane protein 56-B-like [Branchiostoma belcheri]|uniref:Transmembrane protein 56-B-like n=1 Tax=Branchiostoma belcheri TaxID=7741 RepID=A0A6P4Y853_BRABE|nr:PREDICTED: transmembrane protein 56-B-like [Branchiostoma belcheri]